MCENLRIRATMKDFDMDLLEDQIKEVQKILVDIAKSPCVDKDLYKRRLERATRMFKSLLIQKEKLLDSAPQTHKAIQCEEEEYARKYIKHHVLR